MNSYMVYATVSKYDEGLKARTRTNVNTRIEAETEDKAKEIATEQFIKDATHALISNINVRIDLIKQV